ncbi:MAG: hypothetical protein IT518_06515 [Burkholderiales bacterium]|nr:hypothetical protein [Burkholderiales bacterium]
MRHPFTVLIAGLFALPPAIAGVPNTAVGGAVSYEVGQGWTTQAVDEAAQDRWFTFREVGGRSYCIEATLGVATYFALNPSVTLYADTTLATQLGANDDGAGEPPMNKGARLCFMSTIAVSNVSPPASAIRALRVTVPIAAGSGDSGFVRVRVVESTLVAHRAYDGWRFTLSNSGTTSVAGAFYVPSTGKSTNFQIPAQSRASGSISQLIAPSGRVVYFFHNGPAGSISGKLFDDDSSNAIRDESPFQLRRD